jgi:RAT1-interacting protein
MNTVWDAKPATPGAPVNWVELKTSAEIRSHNDQFAFDRKLMKYWIQSFLLGVPKIIVGFRDRDGVLRNVQEFQTISIPYDVQRRGMAKWDGNVCIRFTSLFLDCKSPFLAILPASHRC